MTHAFQSLFILSRQTIELFSFRPKLTYLPLKILEGNFFDFLNFSMGQYSIVALHDWLPHSDAPFFHVCMHTYNFVNFFDTTFVAIFIILFSLFKCSLSRYFSFRTLLFFAEVCLGVYTRLSGQNKQLVLEFNKKKNFG